MKNIYYITNMFPGKNDNYGIFCEKVYNFFEKSDDFCVKRLSAIYGKSHKKLYNIFRYIFLLISITKTLIFSIKKIDLIYIQYIWKHSFFFSNFCPYIKKGNKKLVINFHGEDLTNYSLLSIKEKKSFIRLCMYADLIIVPSVYFKNLLISQLAFCETKIFVSPSGGVNSKNFFKTKKLNTGKTTLVYCSRFDSDKGWDDFILGIKSLSEKKIELKAKMIGYGKQLNDVFNLIEKLGLTQEEKENCIR